MDSDDPIPELKEFAILTNEQFCRAVTSPDATRKWCLAGTIPLDGSEILTVDPRYYEANFENGEEAELGRILPALQNTAATARVFLEIMSAPKRPSYISAVQIMLENVASDDRRELKNGTPVDSARIMIGALSPLRRSWMVCGENSKTSIEVSVKGKSMRPVRNILDALQKIKGVEFKEEKPGKYTFVGKLNGDEIRRARGIVKTSKDLATIITDHQSAVELNTQLDSSLIATVNDFNGNTVAIAFKPGIGNGIFFWDELAFENRVVGYYCQLIDNSP